MGLKLWKMSLAAGVLVLSAAQASALSDIYANEFYLEKGNYSGVAVSRLNETRYDPNSALGNTSNFFSLGIGGIIALSFGENFQEAAIVLEKTNGCDRIADNGGCENYLGESASVYAVSSKVNIESYATDIELEWDAVSGKNIKNYDLTSLINATDPKLVEEVKNVQNGEAQDGVRIELAGAMSRLGSLGYLLIKDTSTGGTNRDGFDLVSARVQPVPVPAALPLFGLVAAGLGFAGWRKRKMA